jgi:c-di-GMP-binding flagellar brake protein YcgR
MRELVVEGQEVLVIPSDYKNAKIGTVTEVRAGDFVLELKEEPNILVNTYCEFYTQTKHGKLYFDSFAKEIKGKTMIISSPAKHKFLQRRQYTRIKYINDFEMSCGNNTYKITTLDISAGGMKIKTKEKIDIEGNYSISIPVSDNKSLNCNFQPIRIEKANGGEYTISGQFTYNSTHDKMVLTQFCAKRSYEIKNK